MKRLSIFSICFFISGVLSSLCLAHTPKIQQTGFRHYSSEQGLSQNTINHIFQDKNQFVWLSTSAGLNRLDGRGIEIIGGPNQTFKNMDVLGIKQDSNNNYWIMSYEGLTKLSGDLEQTEHFDIPSIYEGSEWANYPVDILEINPGEFWLATYEGLFRFSEKGRDIGTIPSMKYFGKNEIKIHQVTPINDQLWIATNKGLYIFDTKNLSLEFLSFKPSLDHKPVLSTTKIGENELLIQYETALYSLKTDGGQHFTKPLFDSDKKIIGLVQYQNTFFFSIEDQLHQYDIVSQKTSHLLTLSDLLPAYVSYDITNLFIDQNSKLWIGTTSQGALVWNPKSMQFRSLLSGVEGTSESLKTIWAFTEDEKGNYWIGSEEGLYYLDSEAKRLTPLITIDSPNIDSFSVRIFQILRINESLWLATADGLLKFEIASGKYKLFRPPNLSGNESLFIYSMANTSERDLWLATDIGPRHFNIDKEIFRRDTLLTEDNSKEISAFVRHYQDKLWFGYAKKLIVYDYKKRRANKIFEAPFKSTNSEIFLTDFGIKDNLLWTAYSGEGIYVSNLNKNNGEIVHHFSPKKGFSDGIIYSLIPDGEYFWASSHNGLLRINTEDFTYRRFNHYDGLTSNEFNEGAVLVNSKGEFIFGGSSDAIIVTPASLEKESPPPIPSISWVRIKDRKILANALSWNDRGLKLTPEEKFIQFQLTNHDYLTPNRWQYQYSLRGPTSIENQTTENHEIIFSDLKPGDYELSIQSYSKESNRYSLENRLKFSVESSFLFTPTVSQTIYVIFALLTLLFFYRRSQIKAKFMSLYHQLKEKENRLELALLDDRRGVWEWSLKGDDIQNSRLTIVLTEDQKLELSFSQYTALIHKEDLERISKSWQSFLQGEKSEFEETYRVYLYERWIWTKVFGKIYSLDISGQPYQAVGSWLDISKDKAYEDSLRIFKSAFQNTQDIILIANHKMDIVSVNQAYEESTGFNKEELIGRNILRVGKQRFSFELIAKLKSHIEKKNSWRGELLIPKKDGTNYLANVTIDKFESEAQSKSYVVVISDISGLSNIKSLKSINSPQREFDGVPNKALVNDRLVHALEHAKVNNTKVTLLNLQVLEKDSSNPVLSDLSPQLIESCNETLKRLIAEDDTLARLGKDRYLLIMEDTCDLEPIIFRIDRLINRLNTQLMSFPEGPKIQFKAGISTYPLQPLSGEDLLIESNNALRSIRQQSNIYNYAHRPLQKLAADKINMKNAMSAALKNDQFFLVYQPKKDIHSLRTVGFEVLLRWRSPDGKIVYPSQFIELAIQAGLINPLTDWLINKALKVLGRWKNEGLRTAFSLNIVPPRRNTSRVISTLLQELNNNTLTTKDLHIEVNEAELSVNDNLGLAFIEELHNQRFQVTIDDFGKWELPFSKLKNLPIYAIKMHRDFTRSIGKDKKNEALTNTIHQLCSQFNLMSTAKGVETREQIEFLRESGSHIVQGYYFSDPLLESQARQYLLENK